MAMPVGNWSKHDLLVLAKAQKSVLWMILVALVAMVCWMIVPVVAYVIGFIQIYFVYRLAKACKTGKIWLYLVS